MVYEPREDSYLLAKCVQKHAYGDVLDMGTGSGIQAQTAQETAKVNSVIAADIDQEAIKRVREQGIQAVQTDLFSQLDHTFDTIICNTPYLPDEPLAPDVALDGGPKGYEWTLRFLKEAKNHLRAHGQILLLISTLTNKHVVEKAMIRHAYDFEIVNTEKISFEELLVYRLTHALPQYPQAEYLTAGRRSRVYRMGELVIKVAETRRVIQESRILQKINEHGIGPEYHEHTDEYIVMEYVDGERIDEYLQTHEDAASVLKQVLEQTHRLDELGINKSEMTNPYKHIIIRDQQPILIDWERAKHTPRPQNTTQFHEYLKRIGYGHLIC